MEAIEFVTNFNFYVDEIIAVVKPDLLPIANSLKTIDPHDLIRPEAYLNSDNEVRGLVWAMFQSRVKKSTEFDSPN